VAVTPGAGGGSPNESSPNAARFRVAKSGSTASQATDWNSRASVSQRDLDMYDDEGNVMGQMGIDHSITSICQVYTWGPNNWGQLGVDSELSSAAQVDPVTTLAPVTGCAAPLNDVCFAGVGGDFMVAVRRFYPPANNENMLPDFQRAWCCGRALATTDAIGGNWRERVHAFTPEPIQGLPPNIPVHSVACGESHMLILTFDGEVSQ
jgi:alpha-tubulin suppressor-like RCC1 family protein